MNLFTFFNFITTTFIITTSSSVDNRPKLLRGTLFEEGAGFNLNLKIEVDHAIIDQYLYDDKCNWILGEAISKAYARVYDQSGADHSLITHLKAVDIEPDDNESMLGDIVNNFFGRMYYYWTAVCRFCPIDDGDEIEYAGYMDDDFLSTKPENKRQQDFLDEIRIILLGSTCKSFHHIDAIKISSYDANIAIAFN